MKIPNVTFRGGRELKTTTFYFFSLTLIPSFIERDGISAMKFEVARLHFLSDVFVAVAVVA